MLNSGVNEIVSSILQGDCVRSVSQAKQLIDSGVSAERIVTHGIETAMLSLDGKCTLEEFNLLEIMLAGRAVMEVMRCLYPAGTALPGAKGMVVVATLEGDVHDLGKNILKMVLIGNGYGVVDCGKDCPIQKLLDRAEKEQPLAIGISGLITPVIPMVKEIKDSMKFRRMEGIKVIAGGAALKQSSPQNLNVDYVADSAFDALHFLDSVRGEKRSMK